MKKLTAYIGITSTGFSYFSNLGVSERIKSKQPWVDAVENAIQNRKCVTPTIIDLSFPQTPTELKFHIDSMAQGDITLETNYSLFLLPYDNIPDGEVITTSPEVRIKLKKINDCESSLISLIHNFYISTLPHLINNEPENLECYWCENVTSNDEVECKLIPQRYNVPMVSFSKDKNGVLKVKTPSISSFGIVESPYFLNIAYCHLRDCIRPFTYKDNVSLPISVEPFNDVNPTFKITNNLWIENLFMDDKNSSLKITNLELEANLSMDGNSITHIFEFLILVGMDSFYYNVFRSVYSDEYVAYTFTAFDSSNNIKFKFQITSFDPAEGFKWTKAFYEKYPGKHLDTITESNSFLYDWGFNNQAKTNMNWSHAKFPSVKKRVQSLIILNFKNVKNFKKKIDPMGINQVLDVFFKKTGVLSGCKGLLIPPTFFSSRENEWFKDSNKIIKEASENGLLWYENPKKFVENFVFESTLSIVEKGKFSVNALLILDAPSDVLEFACQTGEVNDENTDSEKIIQLVKNTFPDISFSDVSFHPQFNEIQVVDLSNSTSHIHNLK